MKKILQHASHISHYPSLSAPCGWIEVICGSMFSGKTQELIRRLRLAQIAKQKVQVFNSALDTRYGQNHIVSHDQAKIPCQPLESIRELLGKVKADTRVIGIDEVHFFSPASSVMKVCESLADQGRRVIVAGLDQDYRGQPFEITAKLMAIAEFVTKNLAICVRCGSPANRSQRLTPTRKRISVGAKDKYEARCRRCFQHKI